MKDPFETDPPRWSAAASNRRSAPEEQTTSRERAVGMLLARVRDATEPSPDTLRERLRPRDEVAARRRPHHRLWRVVVVSLVLMAMGSAVGAALVRWGHIDVEGMLRLRRAVTSSDEGVERRQRGKGGRARPGGGPAAAVEDLPSGEGAGTAEAPPPPPVPTIPPEGTAPPGPVVVVGPAPSAPSEVSPSEAALLGDVFRTLRSGGDPARVLRALDRYDRQFPGGMLRAEARIARAEALVGLGRRVEALPMLEQIDERDDLLTREVRIARGELLAEVGRCARAIDDFDRILVLGGKQDAAGGRALFGRAACRLRADDVAGAREDLETYLALHPDAPSASAARRALDSLP